MEEQNRQKVKSHSKDREKKVGSLERQTFKIIGESSPWPTSREIADQQATRTYIFIAVSAIVLHLCASSNELV